MAMTQTRSPLKTTAIFVLLVVAGGLLIGMVSRPDGWFEALNKPSFQPPNWLFGPVWTVLYILIAVAGARIFATWPRSAAMKAWIGQMILNFMWSPIFFAAHSLVLAFVVILLLLVAIVAFIRLAWPLDRPAALLFLPYALWVAFAAALNGSLILLN